MTRPSDSHFELIGDEAFGQAAAAIQALSEAGLEHVLAGGWAVFAHVPRVPSVDVDVFLPEGAGEQAKELFAAAGLNAGPGGEVELLSLDGEIELWGIGDPDLGIPEPAYVPREIFQGQLQTVALDLQGEEIPARVPSRPALSVTKVVALANRDLGYRAHFEGRAGMLLGPSLAVRVKAKARSYWERKAGKDLFDLSLLIRGTGVEEVFGSLLEEVGLAEDVRTRVSDLHPDVMRYADDLADRSGTKAPGDVLSHLLPG